MQNVSSSNSQAVNVPKLRFPGFTDEWFLSRLDEFCDINPKTADLPEEFIYIDLESVVSGILEKETIICKTDAPSRAQRLLNSNDVLFQTVRPYQKNNYLFNEEKELPTVASTGYAQLRTQNNSYFLYQLINTQTFTDDVLVRCTGSSYPAINSNDMKEIIVAYPSILEQGKIADFLFKLDCRIEKQQVLINYLKLYKRGVLSNLFDEDSEHIKAWKKYQIGDFLSSRIIKQVPSEDAPLMAFTAEGGVEPKGDRYDRSFLVKDENKQYKRTEYNDFIYSSNNLDVGSIGLNKYGTAVISDVYEIFEISSAAHPTFISEAIKQPHTLHKILKYRQGVTYGQYRIYAEDFQSVDVLLPSYDEQCQFALLLDNLDNSIKTQASILYNLQIYKKALLQQMFI